MFRCGIGGFYSVFWPLRVRISIILGGHKKWRNWLRVPRAGKCATSQYLGVKGNTRIV